jgi:hypothetical protein
MYKVCALRSIPFPILSKKNFQLLPTSSTFLLSWVSVPIFNIESVLFSYLPHILNIFLCTSPQQSLHRQPKQAQFQWRWTILKMTVVFTAMVLIYQTLRRYTPKVVILTHSCENLTAHRLCNQFLAIRLFHPHAEIPKASQSKREYCDNWTYLNHKSQLHNC